MFSLLFDFGGTFVKSAIVSNDELIEIELTKTPVPVQHEEGFLSYSNSDVLDAFYFHLNIKSQRYSNISKIFLSSQMACFGLINTSLSFLKNRLISWQTLPNNLDFINHIKEDYELSNLHKRTGETLKYGSPYTVLKYLEHKKSFLDGKFTTLNSLVVESLIGSQATLHITDAAATGIYDLTLNDWINNEEHLKKIEFPEVSRDFPRSYKFNKGEISVFEGVGDQQASLLGVAISENEIVINIGTGGQVATLVKDYIWSNDIQIRPFFNNCFINTITHLPSGRILMKAVLACTGNSSKKDFQIFNHLASKEYVRNVQFNDSFDELFEMLENQLLSQGEFAFRFVNAMAQNYVEAIKKVVFSSRLELNKVILKSAGGVSNTLPILIEMIELKLGKAIIRAESEETTLSGLAQLSRQSHIFD